MGNTQSAVDMTGKRCGRLVVLARAGSDKSGNARWSCLCDCGAQRTILGQSLRSGATMSCGCLNREIVSAMATHGQSGTANYKAWHAMVQRCTNPKHHKYARYGGRGIRVCDRWLTFENFAQDMGTRPPGMTVDRRDNDGDYEPGNCRWATQMEQGNNRGNNRMVTVGGTQQTLSQAARQHGINKGTVRGRISYGWTEERAFTAPTQQHKEN